MSSLSQHFEIRFPNKGRLPAIRAELQRRCEAFIESGLADSNFEIELTSDSNSKFWSRISEALVYQRLSESGLKLGSKVKHSPDFLLLVNGHKIWLEVICPQPSGLDIRWLKFQYQPDEVYSIPDDAILLRWTSAIKEKCEKLFGNADGSIAGYLKCGVVKPEDSYIIAINSCQMRNGPFPSTYGVSGFPYAAEAVLGIGPYQLHFDRVSHKKVQEGHQYRPEIPKPNGSNVPATLFLDKQNSMISAIWAIDFDGSNAIGNPEPSILIHNPNACSPVPNNLLPCNNEYEALLSDHSYTLKPIKKEKTNEH